MGCLDYSQDCLLGGTFLHELFFDVHDLGMTLGLFGIQKPESCIVVVGHY